MTRKSVELSERGKRWAFWLLVALLGVLLVAGGASRADVAGQFVSRLAAWLALIGCIIAVGLPDRRSLGMIAALLTGAVLLCAIQLVPLPPNAWLSLPGRDILAEAAVLIDRPQPWRPISMSPGGTVNALWSLIVPVTVFMLASRLGGSWQRRVLALLLLLILTSGLVALAQFSGASIANPFINSVAGATSGTFANRNHFALFAAIGITLAFTWAFSGGHKARWRPFAAFGAIALLLLLVLASGSRMGMALAAVAIVLGVSINRASLARQANGLPRGVAIGAIVGAVVILSALIAASILLDRAVGVERAAELESAEDLRIAALPTILQMTATYFPFGSGFGTFDPVYRIHEPADLLGMRYLNHAHNDWVEVVLEGGLASVLLIFAALAWFTRRRWQAWRVLDTQDAMLPRTGSAVILLILLASITDYPARTPLIMASLVLAALWLAGAGSVGKSARAS